MTQQTTIQDRRQLRHERVSDTIYIMQHEKIADIFEHTSPYRDEQLRQYVIREAKTHYSRFAQQFVSENTALQLHMYEAYDQGQSDALPQEVLDTVPNTVTRAEFLLKPFLHIHTPHLNHGDEAPFFELFFGRAWKETGDYETVEHQEYMDNALFTLFGALAHRQCLFPVVHTLLAYHTMMVPRNAPPETYFTGHNLLSSLSMYLVLTYDIVQQRLADAMYKQEIPVAWQSPLVIPAFADMVCDHDWFNEIMQDEYEVLVVENDPESPSII